MNSPRNVEFPPWSVNDFHLEFKPVLSYSKPHTFSTFLEKKEKNICIYSLQPGHLKAEQNNRKVKKEVKLKRKGWKRENSKYKRLLPVKIITGP